MFIGEWRRAYRPHLPLHLRRGEGRSCVDLDDSGSMAAPVHGCRDHGWPGKLKLPCPTPARRCAHSVPTAPIFARPAAALTVLA
jgi:hypothetical protein